MSSPVLVSHDYVQTHTMHQRATRQIIDVLSVCLNSTRPKNQWACVRRDKHQELYAKRSRHESTSQSSVYYLAINEASCTFEEVWNLLHFDSSSQFRQMMKLVHGRDFKDGQLLSRNSNEFSKNQSDFKTEHASVSFVYQAHGTSISMFCKPQHLTFFQTLQMIYPEKTPIEYESHKSLSTSSSVAGMKPSRLSKGVHKRTIALSWLPFSRSYETMLEHAPEMNLQYTLIIEEISMNRLRLSCVTSSYHDRNDGPSVISSRMARAITRRLALQSVGQLQVAIMAIRLQTYRQLAPSEWIKNQTRVCCVLCWQRFHALFRRRHHCRLCGEVICGSCSDLQTINTIHVKTKEMTKIRMCHYCRNQAIKSSLKKKVKILETPQSQDFSRKAQMDARVAPFKQILPTSLAFRVPQDTRLPFEKSLISSVDSPSFMKPKLAGTSKLLSIRSMTRSSKNVWHSVPFTMAKSTRFDWLSFQDMPRTEETVFRSFLHPIATSQATFVLPLADTTNWSSTNASLLSSDCFFVDSDEQEMDHFDDRRTSLMSSNMGLLDHDMREWDDLGIPERMNDFEQERFNLLHVIVSRAST
ncbi:hypothetical protein CCR75_003714 [Bremia lactucae]|uniref:FYVE-type domain-containing protein n=1 Tax=Bremia lactucae TaxID=4779 RepID=A0A976IKK2_BRELC|nr:hypothetical protein CCR75_003714 [Bremia lactucae]